MNHRNNIDLIPVLSPMICKQITPPMYSVLALCFSGNFKSIVFTVNKCNLGQKLIDKSKSFVGATRVYVVLDRPSVHIAI